MHKDLEARRAYHREYQRRHPQYNLRYRARLKAEFLAAYGSACACCGETEPLFLSLDHVEGRPAEERNHNKVSGDNILRRARREGWPVKYRILCYNCNCAIGFFGSCPHSKEL